VPGRVGSWVAIHASRRSGEAEKQVVDITSVLPECWQLHEKTHHYTIQVDGQINTRPMSVP